MGHPIRMMTPLSSYGGAEILDVAEQIAAALSGLTGYYVEAILQPDSAAVVECYASSDGDVFGILSALDYLSVFAATGGDVSPRLASVRYGSPFHYGAIYARRDSGIESLLDCHGKRWLATDERSTTGYLIPARGFRANGVIPSEIVFTLSHGAAITALVEGDGDFATCYYDPPGPPQGVDDVWQLGDDPERWLWDLRNQAIYPEAERGTLRDARASIDDMYWIDYLIEDFKVVTLVGDTIPNDCICFGSGFPQEIADALVWAIQAHIATDEGLALWNDDRFYEWTSVSEIVDSLYNGLRRLLRIPIPPDPNAVTVRPGQGISFAQVDYTWESAVILNSDTGQITVDAAQLKAASGLSAGYINVGTDLGWVVQNLPVAVDFPYDSISTRFQLSETSGRNITLLDAYVAFSSEPVASFSVRDLVRFDIGDTAHNAQGFAGVLRAAPAGAPPPAVIGFQLGAVITFCWQPGHANVQAACNQCAPAAAANSLDWLRSTYGLPVLHAHVPGLVGCPTDSIVAQLDLAMVREAGLTWPIAPPGTPAGLANRTAQRMTGFGVAGYEFVRGKLAYLANYGLGALLFVEHQDDGFGAANGTWCGLTSFGRGNPPTAQFIIDRVCRGADVEVGYKWNGGGGHMVNVVGAGWILGAPWIAHVSDHVQSDLDLPPDLKDNEGAGTVDFTFLRDIDGDGLLNLVGERGRPELGIAVSEGMQ